MQPNYTSVMHVMQTHETTELFLIFCRLLCLSMMHIAIVLSPRSKLNIILLIKWIIPRLRHNVKALTYCTRQIVQPLSWPLVNACCSGGMHWPVHTAGIKCCFNDIKGLYYCRQVFPLMQAQNIWAWWPSAAVFTVCSSAAFWPENMETWGDASVSRRHS